MNVKEEDFFSMSQLQDKSKIATVADLVRRGATVLQAPCPRCGSVQIRYKGKIYCTKEDDLAAIDSSSTQQSAPVEEPSAKNQNGAASVQLSQSSDSVRKLLEEKLSTVSKQLDNTTDVDEQSRLLDLISKYVETLEKLKKSGT